MLNQWQPIETAPKDGTHILAISPAYGVRETYWRKYGEGSPAHKDFKEGKGPDGGWDWTEPVNNWASEWNPVWWMPLPPSPFTTIKA